MDGSFVLYDYLFVINIRSMNFFLLYFSLEYVHCMSSMDIIAYGCEEKWEQTNSF